MAVIATGREVFSSWRALSVLASIAAPSLFALIALDNSAEYEDGH
jgi:hypothetical protein